MQTEARARVSKRRNFALVDENVGPKKFRVDMWNYQELSLMYSLFAVMIHLAYESVSLVSSDSVIHSEGCSPSEFSGVSKPEIASKLKTSTAEIPLQGVEYIQFCGIPRFIIRYTRALLIRVAIRIAIHNNRMFKATKKVEGKADEHQYLCDKKSRDFLI